MFCASWPSPGGDAVQQSAGPPAIAIPRERPSPQGWGQAELVDADTVRWQMTYRVLRNEEVVREELADYTWHPVRPDDVITESAAAGLRGERIDHDIVVLRASVRAG